MAGMTLKELVLRILALPAADLDRPAGVWPAGSCPAAGFVPVTGLGVAPDGGPVIVTGKEPG